MFKFVFCAVVAVAAAKPDLLLTPQLTPLTTYVAPATTTITKSASGFVSQGPLVHSSPLVSGFFTKPVVTTYTSPLVQAAPILRAATLPIATTHWIKKRSAPILTTSYIAPTAYTATAPWLTSTLTSTPLISSPLIASTPLVSQPVAYATHLIKKRSAPLITSYATTAPAALTYQSRFDLRGAPYIGAYDAPWAYSAAIPTHSYVI